MRRFAASRALFATFVRGAFTAWFLAGCGDAREAEDVDGGGDAGASADGGSILSPVTEPANPSILPCPDGWVERMRDDVGFCVPWADAPDCGPFERAVPGGRCVHVGSVCPEGDFPEGLPDGTVYVRAGATGGDGSRGAPFGSVADARASIVDGTVVALAEGTYGAFLVANTSYRIVGACVDRVVVGDVGCLGEGLLEISDLRVEGDGMAGLATSAGCSLVGRGLVVRTGDPVQVAQGAIELEDVRVEASGTSFNVLGEGSRVRVRHAQLSAQAMIFASTNGDADMRVEDAVVVPSGEPAESLAALGDRATLVLERVAVMQPYGGSVELLESARARISRGFLAATEGERNAYGLFVDGGAVLELDRVAMDGFARLGAVAFGGGRIVARDLLLQGPAPSVRPSRGVEVDPGSSATLERVRISQVDGVAVAVIGADLEATDLHIEGVAGGSRGLQVQDGASVRGERVWIEGARGIGIGVAGEGTVVRVLDARVLATGEEDCEGEGCGRGGLGFGSYLGASLEAERFEIRDSALAGVQLGGGGTLDLTDGIIADNPVGASLLDADYDVGRLSRRVVFIDNGVNLDTTAMAAPDATIPSF